MVGSVLRPSLRGSAPTLTRERALWDEGHDVVVGIDEVGRGAWAGPLILAAVVLPKQRRVYRVRDSKQLTEAERETMFDRLTAWCDAWAVGHASAEECDELGMSEAQRLAARRALEHLGSAPDHVLIDGKWDFVGGQNVDRVVRGDAQCLSIATASILAKVTRDRLMREAANDHPWWWFEQNKGYPCPRHKAALRGVGPSAIHRRSWVFMDWIPWTGLPRYVRPDPCPDGQEALFEWATPARSPGVPAGLRVQGSADDTLRQREIERQGQAAATAPGLEELVDRAFDDVESP